MMLADANVLIALLVESRAAQTAAALPVLEAARADEQEVMVAESVLVETCWVLESSYGVARQEVSALLGELLAAPPFRAWDAGLAQAGLRLMGEKPALSITDALLVVRAQRTGATVLTFDRGLQRAMRV